MSTPRPLEGDVKPDLGPQVHMTAAVDTREFLRAADALAFALDEAVLRFEDGAVTAEHRGCNNTANLAVSIDAEYTTDHHPTTVGVETDRLRDAFPTFSPDATTDLTLHQDETVLQVGSEASVGEVGLFDPDDVDQPDAMDAGFDFDYEATVDAEQLHCALARLTGAAASHLYVAGDDSGLELRADDMVTERFEHSASVDATPTDGEPSYGFLYLRGDLAQTLDLLPLDDEVVVRLTWPGPMELEAESGIRFTLSPPAIDDAGEIHEAIQAGEHDA